MYADFIMLKAEDMIKNPFHVGAARYHITGENVKLHWHNYFTLDLIIGGSGTHRINGQSEKLCPGMVQMIYPTDIHAIVPDGDIELYSIRFEESALSAELFRYIKFDKSRSIYFGYQYIHHHYGGLFAFIGLFFRDGDRVFLS